MRKTNKRWPSLPADVLWGSFITHSGRNVFVRNEPQRTSAGRLEVA